MQKSRVSNSVGVGYKNIYLEEKKADIPAILWRKSESDWTESKKTGIFSFYKVLKYLIGTNGLR